MEAAGELIHTRTSVQVARGSAPRPGLWLPAVSLCRRELVRFVRQPHRMIGALLTPVVFWLLIGGGMGRSFQAQGLPGGEHYLEFFFPGTIAMILLFTAIFSTISIIEDRREGFLQSVLVAPVSRMAITLGKVLGGSVLAFGQGVLFLALAPTMGIRLSLPSVLLVMAVMWIVSFALTSLGVCLAWRMSSTHGFHAIMNLFLVPMWFLSGALFPPPAGAYNPLGWVMRLNPLTYGVSGIRRALYLDHAATWAMPGLGMSIGISLAFALGMFLLASFIVGGRISSDLQ